MNYVELNGKPINDGQTVSLDHVCQKFEVVVRSLSGLSADNIKNQIQNKYEVVSIKEVDATAYVRR